jgi:hypothetical protein
MTIIRRFTLKAVIECVEIFRVSSYKINCTGYRPHNKVIAETVSFDVNGGGLTSTGTLIQPRSGYFFHLSNLISSV